jgi:lysine 2,3-aminomutase
MSNQLSKTISTPPAVATGYDFRMTPYLESLLRGRPADDPLSLQFLPQEQELTALLHETPDPIGDIPFTPVEGVVHRHPDRVLLKVAHSCPVYCRFCFRRETIGSKGAPLQGPMLHAAIAYVRAHPRIWEVILTGGDPLSLSGRRLREILSDLATIPHVSVLRIHSRVPIVAPHSIDESYIRALEQPLPLYLAVHVNHPDEITDAVVAAVRLLSEAGIVLLSQTVLLKGVNDNEVVLETLFRKLVRLKIRPYYLHHPDLAPGTSHFRVPIEVGQRLMRSLRRTVSGLCLPTYVLDIPGGFGKVPIGPTYVGARDASGCRQIQDSSGTPHAYPE